MLQFDIVIDKDGVFIARKKKGAFDHLKNKSGESNPKQFRIITVNEGEYEKADVFEDFILTLPNGKPDLLNPPGFRQKMKFNVGKLFAAGLRNPDKLKNKVDKMHLKVVE